MSKTHEIDGKKYVEVERKAEVGDKIIVVNPIYSEGYRKGDVFTANDTYDFGKHAGVFVEGISVGIRDEEYHVLEQEKETLDEETPSPDLVDLIANLSAEVTQLKRSHAEQLDTLFRNVQQLGEELATLQTAQPVDNTPVTLPKWIVDRLMGGYRG